MGIELPNVHHANVSQVARDVALGGLRRELYPVCFQDPLDERSEAFLRAVASECEHRAEDFSMPVPRPFRDLCAQVGIDTDGEAGHEALAMLRNLRDKGFLRWSFPNLDGDVWPTYAGMVRATKRDEVEWIERLSGLIREWETTSIEIKRELDLASTRGKRTLVRSVLALATTKSSGPRYLVLGFNPDSHEFTTPVDPDAITQDRIEDILNAYTEPVPQVRWRTVGWPGGLVGVIDVLRDPAHIPYRVKKAIEDLAPGDVFVRHSSHIEPPTDAERDALDAEGRAARGEA